jgi:hypothetical protein
LLFSGILPLFTAKVSNYRIISIYIFLFLLSRAKLARLDLSPDSTGIEAELWSGKIQEHHIRTFLYSFEDNFVAVWGDVEVSNVEFWREVG